MNPILKFNSKRRFRSQNKELICQTLSLSIKSKVLKEFMKG